MTREETLEYKRLWALGHQDHIRLAGQKYRVKNRDKCNQQKREWDKANPEKRKAYWKKYYSENKETRCQKSREWHKTHTKQKALLYRKWSLKNKFNLTVEEANRIHEYQHGTCAICGRPESDFSQRLSIDHDHHTHIIRGLLCWPCNSLLPSRKDLIGLLQKAIIYLQDPPAVKALGEERKANPKRRKRK